MQFGLVIFPTVDTVSVTDLARAAEDHGFESLLFPEHTHIPVSRRSPWPGGTDLPTKYIHLLDPFVALTAAAMVTSHLRIGTGICLVPQHDPIVLAKVVATLDVVSNGRVLFGIGAGWNHEEMRDHGTDPATRWKVMRERVLAMKRIWTQDVAEFTGEFVRFEPTWQWPKPVQKPHPPVVVGGNGPQVLRRVVEYGDAWMPNAARGGAELEVRIPELQQMAAAAGRSPIPVTVFDVQPDAKAIERFAALGAERAVFMLPSEAPKEVLGLVARLGALMKSLR